MCYAGLPVKRMLRLSVKTTVEAPVSEHRREAEMASATGAGRLRKHVKYRAGL